MVYSSFCTLPEHLAHHPHILPFAHQPLLWLRRAHRLPLQLLRRPVQPPPSPGSLSLPEEQAVRAHSPTRSAEARCNTLAWRRASSARSHAGDVKRYSYDLNASRTTALYRRLDLSPRRSNLCSATDPRDRPAPSLPPTSEPFYPEYPLPERLRPVRSSSLPSEV